MPRYFEVVQERTGRVLPPRERELPDDGATCAHARSVVRELSKPPGLIAANDLPHGEVTLCDQNGCLVITVSFV